MLTAGRCGSVGARIEPGFVCRVNRSLILLILTLVAAGCGQAAPATTDDPASSRLPAPTEPPAPVQPASPAEVETSARALAPEEPRPAAVAEAVYRPDDDRPVHDDVRLEQAGIRRYESRRLLLYSDIDPEKADGLPGLVDAVYDEWVAYFGELPPARDGSDFQITGYLIDDLDLFVAAGLVPENLPVFEHGRPKGREFWLHDQSLDYYRAHLLLHEATHCFMTALPRSDGPAWYMEGMAEHFAAHRMDEEGRPAFRILPASPDETPGFSRIDRIQEAVAADRFKPIDEVLELRPADFKGEQGYEWAWAACQFFDSHPRYRDRFRELHDPRLRPVFSKEFRRRFSAEAEQLRRDWALFAGTLCYGYEMEPAVLDLRPGAGLSTGGEVSIEIASDRGWQSSGVQVRAGERYEIVSEGTFTLADEPKPWLSDAGGISFDYAGGHPIGLLLAAVLTGDPAAETDPAGGLLSPIVAGRRATLTAPATGTLYLRINDGWNRLSDNRGRLEVSIRRVGD